METIPKFCKNDPRHMLTRATLSMKLSEEDYNSRIKRYIEDCKICGNDAACLEQANTNLSRDKTTYPWPNYDWDYANYVDNNYSAKATGSNADAGVFNNLKASVKIAKAYITDPNPGTNSKANGDNPLDRQGDFPVYGCEGSRSEGCRNWWKVRKNADLGKPYDDPFFNKYGIDGDKSSSYYYKIGSCRRNINSEEECKKRGYNWISNNCFQDRYAYMDNTGGIKPFRGLMPSIATDMFALNPFYIAGAFTGDGNPNMKIQNCPEEFMNMNNSNSNIWFGLLVGLILVGMSRKLL